MTEQPEQNRVNVGPGGNLDLGWLFTYHPPTPEQIPLYEAIREQGRVFATLIATACPPGPDRSTAIRDVRSAVMWANAAIACQPPKPDEEPVEVPVTLPGVRRCDHASTDGAGPEAFERCVRSYAHDLPTAELPGTPHVDGWGNQWRLGPDGEFVQIGSLPREKVRQIIEDEGTKVRL